MTTKPETALAKRGAVDLVSADSFNEYIADMQQRAFVLSPVTRLGSLPAMWKIVPALVFLNADPLAGEVYRDALFCKGDEVAPTKVGLRRISQAGGMSTGAVRVDSRVIQYLWEFQGFIKYRGFDGQNKSYTASVEWDLRDGSEQVNRMVKAAERNRKQGDKREARVIAASQIDAARLNGYRNGESRAINAAIREFGLRQKYTQKELAEKPFVVFNMVANPDESDPEQRRMLLAHALGGESVLYPHSAPAALPAITSDAPTNDPAVNHATGEIVEGETKKEEPYESTQATSAATDRIYLITGVFRTGNDVYCRTQETGDEPLFFQDVKHADLAKAAFAGKRRVSLAITQGEDAKVITNVAELY